MYSQTMLFRRVVTVVFFLLAVGAANVWAQGRSATISGSVADPTGAAVPEAEIQVRNTETGIAQTIATDGQGRYRVPELGLGSYEVQASKTGFSTVVRRGITLTVGSESVIDFNLPVGQAQETVTVEGAASQVETSSSAVSDLVEQTQMRELPLNGRNFAQLLTLSPGVQQLTQQGSQRYGTQANYSVAGSRGEGQLFLLDSTNTAGFFNHGTGSGASGNSLGVEAIAEFQTLTNTYSAQFGGNGAVMNAVTKSGTNAFHGSLYEFLRNSALDARNFFDTLRKPGQTEAFVPSFRRNQFGGSLGGPLKEDKAFFFFNYEGLRQLLGQTQPTVPVPDANARNGFMPCAAAAAFPCNTTTGLANVGVNPLIASTLALFPAAPAGTPSTNGIANIAQVAGQTVHENYYLGRFDYTFSNKDSLFLRYVYNRAVQFSPFAQTLIPTWPEDDSSRNHYLTIEEKRIITPALINLARFSFVRPYEQGAVNTNTPAIKFYGAGGPDGRVAISGLANIGPGGTVPFSYIPNHFMFADDVLWTKGAHSVRFGVLVDRIRYATNNPFQLAGQYTFTSLTNFLTATPSQFAGPLPGLADGVRDYRELLVQPYFHDEWKVNSRLTLNLGVRYDWAINPTEARHGLTTIIDPPNGLGFEKVPHIFIENPTKKNFAPRVGFAYDPFNDHKTSIRSGFGMFYDTMMAREYIFGFSLAPPFALGSKANPTYGPAFAGGGSPNLPSLNSGQDYRINVTPYMMQYNLNIQRQLPSNFVLTLGYVGSSGVHLLANREENPPTPVIDSDGIYHFADLIDGRITPHPKLNPILGPLPIKRADAHSNYNSLQASLNRRFTGGLQAQVSYTYSKSLDNSSQSNGLESSNSSNTMMNPYEPSREKGRSDFDRTHAFRVSGVYALPFRGNMLVRGWQLSGISTVQSGPPFTIVTGFDQAGFLQNTPNRPNLKPGRVGNVIQAIPTQWYDPTAFTVPAVGTFGNLGRNTGFGASMVNTDFAVLKDTRIATVSETFDVQFRAEIFNIFNHANFGLPNLNVFTQAASGGGNLNPNAGRITTTVTPSRQIQFGLRILF